MSRLENEKESVQNEMEELRRALDVTREDLSDATKANEQMEDEMRSLANGKEELENEVCKMTCHGWQRFRQERTARKSGVLYEIFKVTH